MLDLNDLPVIWNSELSEEEWFNVAHDEYLRIYWCTYIDIATGYTTTINRFCFKPLVDILGRVCNCTRKPNHQGPCRYLRYQLETRESGRYVMKVVDGVKYPDNTTYSSVKMDLNIDPNTQGWFYSSDVEFKVTI